MDVIVTVGVSPVGFCVLGNSSDTVCEIFIDLFHDIDPCSDQKAGGMSFHL